MPLKAEWLVVDRIVMVRGFGDIRVDEIGEVSSFILGLFSSSNAKQVHVIVDGTAVLSFPKYLRDIYENAHFLRDPKMGWMLLCA